MKPKNIKAIPLALAGILLAPLGSQAAVITWGAATTVATTVGNSSDVSINGTLVEAYTGVKAADASGTLTVNTVGFVRTDSLLNLSVNPTSTVDFSTTTNGGDASYDELLSILDFGGGTNLVTLTLGEGDGNGSADGGGDLISTNQYEIQVWYSDTILSTRVTPFGDGEGNTVSLSAAGQFAIGTFTADGTTQELTLASPGFGNAHITAYQIRAIPEPTTTALLGLGGLALILRRRK